MLIDDNRTIYDLIKLTSSGMDIADYPQIKTAIVEKYKEIFGSDIDITNTTADGVFVEDISLMIFNILQAIKVLYSNLNINYASGNYLDALVALSSIYRKSATPSIAQLEILNNEQRDITLDKNNNLQFVDKAGITWSTRVGLIDATESINLIDNQTTIIDVYCDELGPITAPIGWINQLVGNLYYIEINQPREAILGTAKETDSQLRSRRNKTINSAGMTVLSNLEGSLLNISGIEKVYIYNNNKNGTITALDDTYISSKSIYVIIGTKSGITIPNEIIGKKIYEKLTPGINTSKCSDQSQSKSYDYYQNVFFNNESQVIEDSQVTIYWKECKPSTEQFITVTLYKNTNTMFSSDTTPVLIKEALTEYLNNLDINQGFTTSQLIDVINGADPTFNGQKTYFATNCTFAQNTDLNEISLGNNEKFYQLKDKYFYLSDNTLVNMDVEESNNVIRIEFTYEE